MKIGYARVSTSAQNLDMQVTALTDAGCEKIYSEKVSGIAHQEQLQECMQYLREGDCLGIIRDQLTIDNWMNYTNTLNKN